MTDLISGVLSLSYLVIALFFLRFWVSSKDRIFAMFSAAFALMAVQRVALALTRETLEDQTPFYVLRLAAYLLIVGAIVDKNRR